MPKSLLGRTRDVFNMIFSGGAVSSANTLYEEMHNLLLGDKVAIFQMFIDQAGVYAEKGDCNKAVQIYEALRPMADYLGEPFASDFHRKYMNAEAMQDINKRSVNRRPATNCTSNHEDISLSCSGYSIRGSFLTNPKSNW